MQLLVDFEDIAAFHSRSSAIKSEVSAEPVTDLDKQMEETAQTIHNVSNTTVASNNTKRNKSPNNFINLQQGTVPSKRLKEPSLNLSFPSKAGQYELKLIAQPEDQHRARYMTEGSRGAVKDKSQQGNPVIQVNMLFNDNEIMSIHHP